MKNDVNDNNGQQVENNKSSFGKFLSFFNFKNEYLSSEWSFAQFKIPSSKAIVAFGPDNTILVITAQGKYLQANFDTKNGGNCTRLQEKDIMEYDE